MCTQHTHTHTHTHTLFNMLSVDLCVSHVKRLLSSLCVGVGGGVGVCVCASVHAQAYVNIHNSWPGQLSPRSHWPVPPCKHTPTCYWFILSSTHSTRTAGRREGGRVVGGEGGELGSKASRSMYGARRCVEYVCVCGSLHAESRGY